MKYIVLIVAVLCLSDIASGQSLWPKSVTEKNEWKLDSCAVWEQDKNGTPVIKVSVSSDATIVNEPVGASLSVDLKPYRGQQMRFTCISKNEGLSRPPKDWLGFKFMLSFKSEGHYVYDGGGTGVSSTNDWRKVAFIVNVPNDADTGVLCIGLQTIYGKAWFKDVAITPANIFPDVVPIPQGFKCEYSEAVKNMPVMRGCMAPSVTYGAKEADLQDLAAWNANVIRWQINSPSSVKHTDIPMMRKTYVNHILELDRHIPQLRRDGLQVIYNMHFVPGGKIKPSDIAGTAGALADKSISVANNNFRMFYDKKYLDEFVEMWRMIARYYKDEPIVVGYDLYNEPVQTDKVVYDYLYCQYEAAKAIREIDPEKPIIIAANSWSSPGAFSYLKPLPLKNIIYQGHMYIPGSYTHQGVGGDHLERIIKGTLKLQGYPGILENSYYGKEQLRKALQPIRDFQLKYGARIYIGEFSAIRFAPGAAQYIEDVTDIFEEYGWDWCYHAFREWYNWSVEHDENPASTNPVVFDTKRKNILLKHFMKNIRPKY